MNAKTRVVISGLGLVSPLGHTVDEFWANLTAGKIAVEKIKAFAPEDIACHIAAEAHGFDVETMLGDKRMERRMDRFAQFALYAARQAWKQSGLQTETTDMAVDMERVAVIVGNGSGAILTIEKQVTLALEKGYRKVTPFLIPMIIPDTASGHISIELGSMGPHFSMATACATGADCLGTAMRMIQSGEVDVAIAGGTEAAVTHIGMAGFANAKALSTRNDDPRTASRPFDKDRDGFIMGEGACLFVLESLEHAQKRGANILGEILGYGRTSDGYEVVSPRPDGAGSVRAMRLAMKDAGLEPEAIGYVNAHATSTVVGDLAEARAVVTYFGERASDRQLPVSSTKSMTGHMLGAAGAIEALIALMAVRTQTLPPTMNVFNQDPQVLLDVIPNEARKVTGMKYAMSNSFGFFGHNASLIVTGPPVL
jgi:3-oxoacyl-[acyl-carrier-protein] synthase II